ncbi:MAG TPA: hypothetical protein VFE78_01205, partial [Gemmataceae bacterium]|nr:hypothetical protein [Gemmataceae bacterium]
RCAKGSRRKRATAAAIASRLRSSSVRRWSWSIILPQALGGLTQEGNLWLACSLCNDCKNNRIADLDPLTGELVRLFNPRHQVWGEHFEWSPAGDHILGKTPTGRATLTALQLNRPSLVIARRAWVSVGWHPPKD